MANYSEVIYCKDCKFCKREYDAERHEYLFCTKFSRYNNEFWTGPFEFCSWAEYKEAKDENI